MFGAGFVCSKPRRAVVGCVMGVERSSVKSRSSVSFPTPQVSHMRYTLPRLRLVVRETSLHFVFFRVAFYLVTWRIYLAIIAAELARATRKCHRSYRGSVIAVFRFWLGFLSFGH